MKALILDNRVVDIVIKKFPVSKKMSWADCDDSVKKGYFFLDGEFKESDKSDSELLDIVKKNKKRHLSGLISAEMAKPLFSKTVDSEDCYISTDKTNKFLGYFALSDSSSVVRYFRAVSKEGKRLSHDLKLNKTELKELAIHYEQREDQLEELENKYIDLIDTANSKTAINNINFEELE